MSNQPTPEQIAKLPAWAREHIQANAGFRYEHKKLCAERALERGDYHNANIYFAQAAYYFRLIHGIEMTPQNRNLIDHETR